MLEEALSYPTNDDGGLARVLIGGVLLVFAVLVVPLFLVYGYFVRALGAVAQGEETPPAFEDWGGLLVDGLKAFAIGIVYSVVPLAILLVVMIALGAGSTATGGRAGGVLAGIGLIGMLLYLLALLVITWVLMAALTNFAVEDRIGAAFDFGTIGDVVTHGSYVTAFVLAVVIYVALYAIVLVASIFTLGIAAILFVIVGPFVVFWLYLVFAHLFGTAYREALGLEAA